MTKNILDSGTFSPSLLRNVREGVATDEQFIRTYQEMIACKNFVLSLIKTYRNTPDSL